MKFNCICSIIVVLLSCALSNGREIWEGIQTQNLSPVQDYGGHFTVVVGKKIYEFGGIKENRTLPVAESIIDLYADFRVLDTDTLTWSSVVASNGISPPPRGWFGMDTVGDSIYLFGGVSWNFAPLGDFWEFNLITEEWIDRSSITPSPAPRSGLAVNAFEGKIYVTGGLNPFTLVGYPDLWCFDPATLQWTEITTTGVSSVGRALIRTTIYGDYLYVFGGEAFEPSVGYFAYSLEMFRINLHTFVWELVTPDVSLPRVRLHYAVARVGNFWHFHGGDYGNCPPLDLLIQTTSVYDFHKNAWYDGYLPIYEEGPASKRGELSCVYNKCYHTGGYSGIKCNNSELEYINQVYTYEPTNLFVYLARSRN